MSDDWLERIIADLIQHPDSSAHEIGSRIGLPDRLVFGVLDNAAYKGRCQRWHSGVRGTPWRWEVPAGVSGGEA